MKELLNIISEMRHEHDASSKLFHSLSQRLCKIYGDCAIALMSLYDSKPSDVTVTLFYDHSVHTCIEEQNIFNATDCSKSFSGDFIETFLNALEPKKYIGEDYGINSMFNNYFIKYIDAITFPIFHQGNISRWFVIFFPKSNQITKVDMERTLLVSTLIINYIESIQESKKLQEANDWIKAELKAVAGIKQQLLPKTDLKFDELKTLVLYEPCQLSGGDYYDIARLTGFVKMDPAKTGNEIFGIIVADASGHGAASAVEISMFDAILRTYRPDSNEGPAGVFNYVNQYLFTRLIRNGFITAFVSSYQTGTHILRYTNAGHPPPIIKRCSDNTVEILSDNVGIPLGVTQDYQWESSEVIININDIFIAYTDGITESKSPDGKLFGEKKLVSIIKKSSNSAEDILENIKQALTLHQGDFSKSDDVTLIIIQPNL